MSPVNYLAISFIAFVVVVVWYLRTLFVLVAISDKEWDRNNEWELLNARFSVGIGMFLCLFMLAYAIHGELDESPNILKFVVIICCFAGSLLFGALCNVSIIALRIMLKTTDTEEDDRSMKEPFHMV